MFTTLISQIFIMFLLMGFGVLASKLKIIRRESSDDLTALLINIISPALIIMALQRPITDDILHIIFLVGLGVVAIYLIEIVISHLTFSKLSNIDSRRSAIFASVYNNVGFIGIPLVSAVIGQDGVLYAVISMIVYNIFCWTHGSSLFQPDLSFGDRIRSIFLNPNVIAIIIGLCLFFTSTNIPSIIGNTLTYLGNANTPLSMLIIGFTLANARLKKETFNKTVLTSVLFRNIVFPLLSMMVFKLIGLEGINYTASLLIAACPAPSLVVIFTIQAKGNTDDAVAEVGLSTLFSLISIPFIFAISNFLF
ncbi:AEC family transporter [Streptococcus henryi]|uniref:AEC family transporter n=1 Tax=Streptococcus henryi TaxID=439219 RepID=UPI00036CDF89|nr:AEC family transporter [Streptococcus henryi]